MIIDGDILTMCRLVAFAEEEKFHAMATNLNPEYYAKEVLNRFKKLYPNAILVTGNPLVGGKIWKDMIKHDYVLCGLDGTWEFYSKDTSISIEVKTDGSINLSEGCAEQIFNYVND